MVRFSYLNWENVAVNEPDTWPSDRLAVNPLDYSVNAPQNRGNQAPQFTTVNRKSRRSCARSRRHSLIAVLVNGDRVCNVSVVRDLVEWKKH